MSFFINKTAGASRITRISDSGVKLSLFVSLLLAMLLSTFAPQVNAAVSVKTVSPTAVVLTLNKKVVVRLTGTNLSKVTRANVMQGRRSLGSAVYTRLKCVGSSCTLELTLKRNIAAGAYTVQLLGSSRQPAVNVPLKIVVRSAAKKPTAKRATPPPPRSTKTARAVTLSRLTLSSSTTTTGKRVVGRVRLNAAAPAGGTSLILSSSNAQIASVNQTKIILITI